MIPLTAHIMSTRNHSSRQTKYPLPSRIPPHSLPEKAYHRLRQAIMHVKSARTTTKMGLNHDEARPSFLWDFLDRKNLLRTLTVARTLLHLRDGVTSFRALSITPGSALGSLESPPRTSGNVNLLWGALISGISGTKSDCERGLLSGLGGRFRASRWTGGLGSAKI